jgi:hypothetical protein
MTVVSIPNVMIAQHELADYSLYKISAVTGRISFTSKFSRTH